MPVPDASGNKSCLASRVTYRKNMIWLCSIPGANRATCYLVTSVTTLLFLTFNGVMLRLVCLYLKMPVIITVLVFVVETIRCKWQQCECENPLICIGVCIRTASIVCAQILVKVPTWCTCTEYTVLNGRGIKFLGHPDTFFKQNPIDPTYPIRKDRETFFETKCFKVDEARGVHGSIAVLIGAKIVCALVEKNFFIDLRQ